MKIDKSFIGNIEVDPRRVELVRAVLTLGGVLGKRIIAEGVENQAQLEILRSLGCEFVQGFLLSKPLPYEAITNLFAPPSIDLKPVVDPMLRSWSTAHS